MKSNRWWYATSAAWFVAGAVLLAACSNLSPEAPQAVHPQAHEPIVVTRTTDDGLEGELRSAVMAAQAGGIIVFAPELEGAEIVLRYQLTIAKSLNIIGPANGIIISGNDFDRVFSINGPTGGNITVRLENLTITKGYASFGSGGGIYNGPFSTLTLKNSRVVKNTSSHVGGGIANLGTLTLIGSTVAHNHAEASGGGIDSFSPLVNGTPVLSSVTLVNSTVSTNSATRAGGMAVSQSTARLVSSTVTGNTATYIGGIMLWDGLAGDYPAPELDLVNSVVANSVDNYGNLDLAKYEPDVNRGTVSASHSLVETLAEEIPVESGVSGNLVGVDPALAPLADNGGPTMTHALLDSSPAMDAGDNTVCAAEPVNSRDQRGVERPQGAGCDMGAFELERAAPEPDPVTIELSIEPNGSVNKNSGSATVSGSMTCSSPAQVTLQVQVAQEQKQRRLTTTVEGSATATLACSGSSDWSVALTPGNGVFVNGDAEVEARAFDAASPSQVNQSVWFFWSK